MDVPSRRWNGSIATTGLVLVCISLGLTCMYLWHRDASVGGIQANNAFSLGEKIYFGYLDGRKYQSSVVASELAGQSVCDIEKREPQIGPAKAVSLARAALTRQFPKLVALSVEAITLDVVAPGNTCAYMVEFERSPGNAVGFIAVVLMNGTVQPLSIVTE